MAKSRYSEYSKEQLLEKIKQLEKKRYGLVWEDKAEEVAERCDRELPVFVHRPDKEILENPDGPTNLLFEGDNYHCLFALNFTHRRKIDVIYIDPPYNTGAKNWKYNNDYVDKNDRYRHSKWLSMMSKRLRLAKNLLADDGMICVAIDDYEVPRVTVLLEEIFGEGNHLGTVVIRNNPSGRSTVRGFAVAHEYALFFAKSERARIGRLGRGDRQLARYSEEDEFGRYEWVNFRKHGGANANRSARRKLYYPIFASQRGTFRVPENMEWDDDKSEWHLKEKPRPGEEIVYPINSAGEEKTWKRSHLRVRGEPGEFKVKRDQTGGLGLYVKSRMNESGMLPLTWFEKKEYSSTDYGTNMLTRIFGESQVFSYPKSLFAVMDCLKIMSPKKDARILDFFAGSGTTGHAVLELNKQDGGTRSFILCTNNENGIAEEVCYERINKVIRGSAAYDESRLVLFEVRLTEDVLRNIDAVLEEADALIDDSSNFSRTEIKIEDQLLRVYGITDTKSIDSRRPANLKYFATEFVPNVLTDNDKRILVSRSTELLCLAEDTFSPVLSDKEFAVFGKANNKKFTAIIYDEDAIQDCVAELNRLDLKATTVIYVFSYDQHYNAEDFVDLRIRFKVKPIPEAILNVYRKNAKQLRK